VTAIKLDSKLANPAADALDSLTARLYAKPGMRIVGVVELAHVERTQPAPDSDKEASVKLQIKHLEIANPQQEEAVREAQRALYLHRTAQGTLTDDGEIELSRDTIAQTGGMLHAIEAARLRATVKHWQEYATRVRHDGKLTTSQLANELATIADGLSAALRADENGQVA
jgi:hypothetical protein